MASAKKGTDVRVRTENVPIVTLTLDKEEAEALHAVLRNVGGMPEKGRKQADSVLNALIGAGVDSYARFNIAGALYFGGKPSSIFNTVAPL